MLFSLKVAVVLAVLGSAYGRSIQRDDSSKKDATVLILGGGVAGVIAARTLHEKGITNFRIVEARDELGGRMKSQTFGAPGREVTIEVSLLEMSGSIMF